MVKDQGRLILIGKVNFFNDYSSFKGSINTMGRTYTKGIYQFWKSTFCPNNYYMADSKTNIVTTFEIQPCITLSLVKNTLIITHLSQPYFEESVRMKLTLLE
jgi:hypothetical protein